MKKKQRRTPSIFDTICYVYVRKANKTHAKTHGTKLFGSESAYIDALISIDRGVKPVLTKSKAKAETEEKTMVKAASTKAKKKASARKKPVAEQRSRRPVLLGKPEIISESHAKVTVEKELSAQPVSEADLEAVNDSQMEESVDSYVEGTDETPSVSEPSEPVVNDFEAYE